MLEGQRLEELIGRSFGSYHVVRILATSRTSALYAAVQEATGRRVALQFFHPYFDHDQGFRERFASASAALRQLDHPNIARVLDAGNDGDLHYLVLALADAEGLRQWLAKQPPVDTPARTASVLAVVAQVGSALAQAHALGIVHGDLSPGVIAVTSDGHVLLRDLGIAGMIGEAAGVLINTPEYMAPEQISRAQPVGPATDEYALAIITYELLAGRPPFQASTPAAVMRLQQEEPPPAPRSLAPSLPAEAEAVLLRALAKDPAARHGSVDAFLASLLLALAPPAPAATPAQPASAPPPAAEPAPVVAAAAPASGEPTPTRPARQPSSGRSSRLGAVAAAVATVLVVGATLAGAYLILNPPRGGRADLATPVAPASTPTPAGASDRPATPVPAAAPTATAAGAPAATTAATRAIAAAPTPAGSQAQASATPPPPAATATAAPPAPTAAAGAGGIQDVQLAILFSSHRGGVHDSQIYVMNPDGSNQRQVTTTRGHSWAPRAAPDGKRMLFSSVAPGQHNSHEATGGGTSANPGNHDIYLADVDGANIINLTARFNSWDNGWSWSPDGKWIAFASDRDGNWELYKMTVDGETIVRLTDHPAADGWPSWTPDSKRIVFASNRAGNWEIYAMDQDGANVQRLTFRPDTYDTFPFISPDGTRIVFSSQIEGRNEGEIYIMNVDGSKVTRLTHTVALNNLPSWCPDGDKIVFVSDRDGDENIWIMNADGSGQKQLTTVKGEDTTPNCAYIRRIGP